MGVRQAIAYMRDYFVGRDAFAANAIVSEMLYGTQAPNPADAPKGVMPGGMRPDPDFRHAPQLIRIKEEETA
jgi:hypothetical protein